jgi:hypothetical protein
MTNGTGANVQHVGPGPNGKAYSNLKGGVYFPFRLQHFFRFESFRSRVGFGVVSITCGRHLSSSFSWLRSRKHQAVQVLCIGALLRAAFSHLLQSSAPRDHLVCYSMDSLVVLFVRLKSREVLEISEH